MAILAECPICHKKQSTKNKKCSCGLALDEAKKAKKVRYWISYRMPDGKQRRESVGGFEGLDPYSIKDAKVGIFKGIAYTDYPYKSKNSLGGIMSRES